MYYLTESIQHQANLKLSFDPGFLGLIQVYANYRNIKAKDSVIFSNDNFNEFNISVEFLLNVY